MRKVYFKQGSDEWLAWRRTLLTATDAAMLLGENPWVTPFQGYQRKVGDIPEQEVNSNMLRGIRDEPIAREMFIKESGINFTPCCIESDLYKNMGASLDGISDCGKYVLEIKSQYPVAIKAMGIPDYHMYQMQHQMMCTDGLAEKAYYVSYWDGEIIWFEVLPNETWMKDYLVKAKEFWKRCMLRDAPPLTNKDYVEMSEVPPWNELSEAYRKVDQQIKNLEKQKEKYKRDLIDLANKNSCSGGGIKLMKKFIQGRIDYKEACETFAVTEEQLEKFRKNGSESWTIMIDKE